MSDKPVHDFTIFCDDIREESSGKLIIIGLYAKDIVLATPLPVTLPKLCFLTRLNGGSGEHEVKHSLKTPEGKELLNDMTPGKIQASPTGMGNLVVNVAPFVADKEGRYEYSVIIDGETVHSLEFNLSVRTVQ